MKQFRFVTTMLLGILLMVLEGVFLAVFQIDSVAFQLPLALAIFAARERSLDDACWLMVCWIIPAFFLLLIPDFRWFFALIVVFTLAVVFAKTIRTEHRSIETIGNLILITLFQGIIGALALLFSLQPQVGVAAFTTVLPTLFFTALSVFLLQQLFRYLDERFFAL